jgi:hypothetical protein
MFFFIAGMRFPASVSLKNSSKSFQLYHFGLNLFLRFSAFVACCVLMCVSPKSPSWNGSKSLCENPC